MAERETAVTELEESFTRLIRHHRQVLSRQADALAPGMSLGAMKAFLALERHGPLTPSALADRLGAGRAQTSRMLRELEEHGLVHREADPQDRRSALLTPSTLGHQRLASLRQDGGAGRLHRVLQDWDPQDVRTLARLLTRLVDEGEGQECAHLTR
ncbi:MarR family winged helix-turn-helix transcriptional regulator [Micrococcus sp.]|uniref:MarR family winged helix-turn-helix transcriptional regulator n=1 Tax=Micrococcus sp. TaxID=1271 RepID=UPI002A9117F1|nr:MarR family transcriptional regulator [Micrococcus sp.]MDY6056048.1 MarR family transcriptional regulator [Micrococcus sp.]